MLPSASAFAPVFTATGCVSSTAVLARRFCPSVQPPYASPTVPPVIVSVLFFVLPFFAIVYPARAAVCVPAVMVSLLFSVVLP